MQELTSSAIIDILSSRLKTIRLDMNLTQEELAQISGVSTRSIVNIENSSDIKLSSFIKILKALEIADRLELVLPDERKRPSYYLESNKHKQRSRKSSEISKNEPFRWGDGK